MVLVAEHWHGDLRALALRNLRRRQLLAPLERPAAVAVDLPGPRLRPAGRVPPSRSVALSSFVRRGLRASITVASTICPPIARYPRSCSKRSKRSNSFANVPLRVSCSRNSQIVLASGIGS
jgi:hypothetical protein